MDKSKKLLTKWDNSLSPAQHNTLDARLERRRFLHTSCKAAAGAALIPSIALFSACDQTTKTKTAKALLAEPWPTFAAVQLILFPDDHNGPSAMDLNATAYLNFVLNANDADKEEREFIFKGIGWLNQLANTEYKINFLNASLEQQEKLIHKISISQSGERWLSYLLLYLFEALLTDPIYGSNPNGIGWQWLEHQPGFPTPDKTKTYPELQKR